MTHASVDFFVLSFVLPCAYAYVASENQLKATPTSISYGRIKANLKENSSCFVFVKLIGKFIILLMLLSLVRTWLKPVFHFNRIVAKRSVFHCFVNTQAELIIWT